MTVFCKELLITNAKSGSRRINVCCTIIPIIIALFTLVIAYTACRFITYEQRIILLVSTIYNTFIATAEYVTEATGHTLVGTDFTAVYVHIGLTEYEALDLHIQRGHEVLIHIHGTVAAPTVLTTTTAKDVTQDVTVVHSHMCLTCLEDTGIAIHYALIFC